MEHIIKCKRNEVERERGGKEREGREGEGVERERKGRGCMACLSIHGCMFSEI